MKKVFALLLTLALIATLSVVAFAADVEGLTTTEGSNTASENLTVTYTSTVDETPVYSVDVSWTDMVVVYNAGALGWNPESHEYDVVKADSWTDSTATITVTNHSNAKVNASVGVAAVSGVSFDVTAAGEIDSAVETEVAQAPSKVFTVTASGDLAANASPAVTVTITAAA